VAFTTTALLFELSLPRNAAWREAVKRELTAAFGVPTCDCADCTVAARKAGGAGAAPPTRQSCVQRIIQAAYQRHGTPSVAQPPSTSTAAGGLPTGGQSVFFTGAGAALSAAAAAEVTATLGGSGGAPATAATTGAGNSTGASAASGDSTPPAWRAPERRDLEAATTLAVTSRAWRETLRLHVVSLGTLRK